MVDSIRAKRAGGLEEVIAGFTSRPRANRRPRRRFSRQWPPCLHKPKYIFDSTRARGTNSGLEHHKDIERFRERLLRDIAIQARRLIDVSAIFRHWKVRWRTLGFLTERFEYVGERGVQRERPCSS